MASTAALAESGMETTTAFEKMVSSTKRTDWRRLGRIVLEEDEPVGAGDAVRPDDGPLHGPHRLQAGLAHQDEELHRPVPDGGPVREREPRRTGGHGQHREPHAPLAASARRSRLPRFGGHPRKPPAR